MAEDMFHLAVLFEDEDFFLLATSLYEEQADIAERKEECSILFNFTAITNGTSLEMFWKKHLRIPDLVKLDNIVILT